MSESLKRLREETIKAERRFEYVAKRPKEFAPSQIEETMRALNKAREEEQRVKEELKQTQLEGLRAYIRLLAHALDDERTALGVYDELIRNATATYDKRELEIILAEERQHKARLEALISEREHEFKSLTYRKG